MKKRIKKTFRVEPTKGRDRQTKGRDRQTKEDTDRQMEEIGEHRKTYRIK
jgi:hypothetical protein